MSRHVVMVRLPLTDAQWDIFRSIAQRHRMTTRDWLNEWVKGAVDEKAQNLLR